MIYGYVRVSKDAQNYDLQINSLKDCDKIYKEKISGTVSHRPELINMISQLKPGDTVKVYKLDRLGRSISDLIKIITHFKDNDINFVSVTDSIDTSTLNGRLLFNILASFAEFERGLISERTIAGLQAARERGVKLGQPNKWTAKQLKQVRDMKQDGYKIKDISEIMHIPVSTIYRYFSILNS